MPKRRNKIVMPKEARGWKSCILFGTMYVLHPTKGWRKRGATGDHKENLNIPFEGLERI